MGHKEDKLWQAIATPPIESAEPPEADVSADLATAPPLDPELRERLMAAALAQVDKETSSGRMSEPPRPTGGEPPAVTPAEGGTGPMGPRSRAAGPRWWRRPWMRALAVAASLTLAVLVGRRAGWLGPGGDAESHVPGYVLEMSGYMRYLGSSRPGHEDPREVIPLSLRGRLHANLRAVETVTGVPGVKVWVEQQGRLMPWPVQVLPEPRNVVVSLESQVPLSSISWDGAKVGAGAATLLVAVGRPEGLPSEVSVVEVLRGAKQEPKAWYLLQQPIRVVAEGERD